MSEATLITTGEQSAKQQRRLAVLDLLAEEVDADIALTQHDEVVEQDGQVAIPASWLDHPADELVWLPRAAAALGVDLDSDEYEVVATQLSNQGLSGFDSDTMTAQEQQEAEEIRAEMETVEVGDMVRWNGRSVPQQVTDAGGGWFEVEGSRGGHYRHKFGNEDERPHLTNLNSGNDYDVDDFENVTN